MMRAWGSVVLTGLFGFVLIVFLFAVFSRILFKLCDLLERRCEPLLFVEQRSLTRRRFARAQFLRVRSAIAWTCWRAASRCASNVA